MTNQGVAFQYISQNKSCMFSTPQRSTICNHPSGCRTASQRWESCRNQNSNVFVNHFAFKGDICDENIQQSLPLGEFERMTKEHINEYGPVQAYNNTLYKRVMIDKMEHVAMDRFLGRHLLDVINNNENENEAHFNSLVDHNYSRQQAENLSYKDLNRFNPASYANCQNNNNYRRLEQSRFIGTTHNFTSTKPTIGKQNIRRSVPSFTANREIKSILVQQSSLLQSALKDVMTNNTAAFNDDVVQIINPGRNIAMNSYTKVGQNQQQDVNSNKSLTEKSSSCFKLDLSQKNQQITVSKSDQCFMVKPCGIQNIIISPRKNRNVPVNLTATGVNEQDSVLNFTDSDNCHCEFQQWKDITSHQSPEAERNLSCHEFQQSIDTTLRQCPEDERNLSCHEFQQPIHRNCHQCPAAEINMNLPDSPLEKSHCNNGAITIVPCGNVVHNRQYIDCKIGQEKIQNINSECLQRSQKYCCESQREISNNVEEQICSLDKKNSFEGSKFVQVLSGILKTIPIQSRKNTDITSCQNREKISSDDIISTENCIQDCGHSVQLVKSTANCSIDSIVSSVINEENFSQSEVRLLNGGIESSSSSLVLEYSKVPKKMDKDKNLDETKKMYFPLLSESAENNVRALLSEYTEKINVASLPSESTENMNVDPLLSESMESNVIYALPSTSNLPQTDHTENGILQNEKQLENDNVVQNENTKKMDLLNDTYPSLLLTENRKKENIKRNVKGRRKKQSLADCQLMVEAMQFLCRGKLIDNFKNMKIDCFMEEPMSTRQKSSAKKCIEKRMVKKLGRTSYVEKLKGGDVFVPVNVTSKKDELAKECSENRNDDVVEKNCSQIEEKKSDSSSTNGTSGESKKRALKKKQYDKEGNKPKEKIHAICNSSNESMELDSGDQLNLDKSKILEKTISEINVENNTVTMATKNTPKRKLEFDKETDYLEIDIGENMNHQNRIGKTFKRSCSTNNTGDSIEIVQSKQTAKRKLYPDNETGEPKVNKAEASDVKLSKSETDSVDKCNQVISKSKKKTKSNRNAEDVIEPIPCDQIDKSCSRSSESQLNRKGRKIQNSSNKNSKLIINSSTKSGKKKLETKLKSWKKMSGLKMTKSSMATNTSNNGKVQFRLVTEPAEQKIVKPKTEALKNCGCCHSRNSINHVQIHHPYRCDKCCLLFSTKKEKSRHRRKMHITKKYHCITCVRLFYMKRSYEQHLASSVHKKVRNIYRRAVDIMKSYLGLGVEPACRGMTILTDGSSSTAVDSVNSHNAIISTGQVDSLFSNMEGVSFSQHEPEIQMLLKDFADVKSCMLSNNAANFSLPFYDMQNNQSAFYSCNNVSEQMSQTYIYTANTKCTDDNAQLPVDANVSHSLNYPKMTQNSQDISFISQNPLAIDNNGTSSSILDLDESFFGYIKNTDDRSEFSAVSSSLEAVQSVTSPTKCLISDAFQLLESDGYYDSDHFKSVGLDGNVDLDIDVLNEFLEMTDNSCQVDLKVDFSKV